jgi:ABC-2 type transport system permease protein
MTIQTNPLEQRTQPTLNAGASFLVASLEVAARTVKKFVRSPQLIVAGTAQGALFLLIFRYVFGGSISHTGSLSYVDYFIPGFVVTSVLFSGMGAAAGIAEDLQGGLFDRLRSLPIRLVSIVSGRVSADTSLLTWGLAVTIFFGVLVGFRPQNGPAAAAAAFGLCVLYGFVFCWLFIGLGLIAGSPQAAQGISFLVFPLSFVSSAYVPVDTMPGWMQAFARHQPLTYMSDTVRLLTEGHPAQQLVGQALHTTLPISLLWAAGILVVFAPLTVWQLRRS